MGVFSLYGDIIPFFVIQKFGFYIGKNVKLLRFLYCDIYPYIIEFVWRQLEFAFFSAVTPVAALFDF